MVTTERAYYVFLLLLGAERLFELALSHRNKQRVLARGGFEVGQRHFGAMGLFHAAFLLSCAAEVSELHRPFPGALGFACLAGALAAQALRYWAIATLGDRWNVRVIVEPGAAPVTAGPYRFLRHPNYLAVALEIALVPLIHGAFITAITYSLGNAALLWVRIRVEEEALGARYARAFAGKPRFVPSAWRGR